MKSEATATNQLGTVSAVLPTYNSVDFVDRAIESVLGQPGFAVVELIVVDDGSTDGTAQFIAERYGSDPRVKTLTTPVNSGPGIARNRGIAAATGIWIAPIDADDAWAMGRLEKLSDIVRPETDILFDNLIGYDQAARAETGPIFRSIPEELSIEAMAGAEAPGSTFNYGYLKPLIRRSFLERTGVSYPAMRISEDLLFYLELLANRPRMRGTAAAGYIYTTPIGLFSRRRSSVTASVPDDLLVADALENFLRTHGNRLNASESQAISQRAVGLRELAPLNQLYDSWTRRHYLSALRIWLTNKDARGSLMRKLHGGRRARLPPPH